MKPVVQVCDGTQIVSATDEVREIWQEWKSEKGPPVPVIILEDVWDTLLNAALSTSDPVTHPRVFRLFMIRREPRHVVKASEIEKVRLTNKGGIRWKEGGYPSRKDPLRKGGNCFIRGDVRLQLRDAWWMGREQTDLRILMAKGRGNKVKVSAWWSRDDSTNGTDGDLWPVKLIIERAA